jgi:hypothetical protein
MHPLPGLEPICDRRKVRRQEGGLLIKPRSLRQPEADRNAGDGRRGAHNPKVAGSDPGPRYQVCRSEASFDPGRGLLSLANELVNGPSDTSGRLAWWQLSGLSWRKAAGRWA